MTNKFGLLSGFRFSGSGGGKDLEVVKNRAVLLFGAIPQGLPWHLACSRGISDLSDYSLVEQSFLEISSKTFHLVLFIYLVIVLVFGIWWLV